MELLTLSEAKSTELEAIKEFIAEEESEFIVCPPDEKQLEAIVLGAFFVLKEASGKIAGITSAISTELEDNVELANSLVAERWRGFGLQHLFVLVRVATMAALFEEPQQLLTAVMPHNQISRRNMERDGFLPAPDLRWECGNCQYKSDATAKGRECCCDAYRLSTQRQRQMCAEFLELTKTGAPVQFSRRSGETVKIMVDCLIGLGEEYRGDILAFAQT